MQSSSTRIASLISVSISYWLLKRMKSSMIEYNLLHNGHLGQFNLEDFEPQIVILWKRKKRERKKTLCLTKNVKKCINVSFFFVRRKKNFVAKEIFYLFYPKILMAKYCLQKLSSISSSFFIVIKIAIFNQLVREKVFSQSLKQTLFFRDENRGWGWWRGGWWKMYSKTWWNPMLIFLPAINGFTLFKRIAIYKKNTSQIINWLYIVSVHFDDWTKNQFLHHFIMIEKNFLPSYKVSTLFVSNIYHPISIQSFIITKLVTFLLPSTLSLYCKVKLSRLIILWLLLHYYSLPFNGCVHLM